MLTRILVRSVTGAVLLFSLATAEAAAAGSAPVTVSEVASFHWSNVLAASKTVRLVGSNGGVSASASPDGKLDVRAVTREGDAARVRVIAREEAGGVVVCVLFVDESPDVCRLSGVNRSGSGSNHRNEPTVDLIARVPAGASLNAATLNGAIAAHDIGGEVRAMTLNGDVEVTATTIAEASSLNGNVTAVFGRAPVATAKFSTSNGNVLVTVPRGSNADVQASTMHGEITSMGPIAVESVPGGFGPKSGKGKLGSGGVRIEASSLNGNVEFRTAL